MRDFLRDERLRWLLPLVLAVLAFLSLAESIRSSPAAADAAWWSRLWQDFGVELIGALVIYGLIEWAISRHDRQVRERRRLIREVGEASNVVTQAAVETLRCRGWLSGPEGALIDADLCDANLRGVDLTRANLQGADLSGADLQGANLSHANLRSARLDHVQLDAANLTHASLQDANLKYARLNEANLSHAMLQNANLESAVMVEADLTRANLQGAMLMGAGLQGAILSHAVLDGVTWQRVSASWPGATQTARLPDNSKWTPNTDMRKFTNPQDAFFTDWRAWWQEEEARIQQIMDKDAQENEWGDDVPYIPF
jgi:hypothetical protein